MVPYWCLSKSCINLNTQTCLDNHQESASFPHTHLSEKKGWFRGCQKPQEKTSTKASEIKDKRPPKGTRPTTIGQRQRPWLGLNGQPPFFLEQKKTGCGSTVPVKLVPMEGMTILQIAVGEAQDVNASINLVEQSFLWMLYQWIRA